MGEHGAGETCPDPGGAQGRNVKAEEKGVRAASRFVGLPGQDPAGEAGEDHPAGASPEARDLGVQETGAT